MIWGWLNVGTQKIKFGGNGRCPCCGIATESQLHLYSCTHPDMSDAFYADVAEITSNLVKEGITSQVYTSFVNSLCEASGRPSQNEFEVTDERCHITVQCQETLEREAILRGFHHTAWANLLLETWIPPKRDQNGKRLEKRDPIQQAFLLIRNTWSLFNRLWECRNSILHSNESKVAEREEEMTTISLLDFKRNNLVKLRRCDRYLIDNYEESDIIKWHPPRKRAVLALMTRLHKIFVIEEKNAAPVHHDIRDFFAPIVTASAASSTPGNRSWYLFQGI